MVGQAGFEPASLVHHHSHKHVFEFSPDFNAETPIAVGVKLVILYVCTKVIPDR